MKKAISIAIAALFIINLAAPAFCENNAITKLGRGLCNMLTFPLEVPQQISKTNNSDGPFAGSTVGVLKGFGAAGMRALVGIYETLTFPVPCPKDYAPIMKDPEYFFEDSNI